MEPRLPNSRKWSPLPEELIKQIRSVFKQNFKQQIGSGTIEASGRIYPEEILVLVGVRAPKALKQANWGISIQYKRNKDNVVGLLHLAVDAAASLFEQYFASESDEDFPRVWEEVDFEKRKIYVQYDTVNSELESEADRLLGQKANETDLAQGDWDGDAKLEDIKAQLGLGPDEDDEGGTEH